MSRKITHKMSPEVEPNWVEKLSLLSSMFPFSFLIGMSLVIMPLTGVLMPNGGWLGFTLRLGALWVTLFLITHYLNEIKTSYIKRVEEYMSSISAEITSNITPEEDSTTES